MPSLTAPDIERHHYGESFAAEQLQLLQQAQKLAQQTAEVQGQKKYKANFDIQTAAHKFLIGQKVWLNDTKSISKNAKLSPNWIGPFKIIDINDNNAKLKLKNNNVKFVNIACIKDYVEEGTKTSPE